MSISNRFFERLERRRWALEILYYRERCLLNSYLNNDKLSDTEALEMKESFLDQAHRLTDLLEQIALATSDKRQRRLFV